MGIAPLLPWRKATPKYVLRALIFPKNYVHLTEDEREWVPDGPGQAPAGNAGGGADAAAAAGDGAPVAAAVGRVYDRAAADAGAAAADALTWQIQLHEGTNEVETLYEDVQGGYGSDNEYMTVGIQGTPESALEGLQYSYRQNPDVPAETAVIFSAPQPPTNDLRLTGSTIPDPVSLAAQNVFGAEVTNKGVNCDRSSDPECATPETDIDVSASVFSIQESVTTYDLDDLSLIHI